MYINEKYLSFYKCFKNKIENLIIINWTIWYQIDSLYVKIKTILNFKHRTWIIVLIMIYNIIKIKKLKI